MDVVKIERIQRVDLQEKIIWEIKKHIFDNRLQPGTALPSQASMAAMTGASRASIREAVKTMEAQGLLRTINGKGIYVENVDTSFSPTPATTGYILKLLIDSFSVRKALEGMAVEQCTLYASDHDLQKLSDILLKVETRYYNGEEQSDLDLLFHQTLISLAGNNLLSHMLKNLMHTSSGMWKMEDRIAQIFSDSIPGHRRVMDKMLARDVRAAVHEHNEYMDKTIFQMKALLSQSAD